MASTQPYTYMSNGISNESISNLRVAGKKIAISLFLKLYSVG